MKSQAVNSIDSAAGAPLLIDAQPSQIMEEHPVQVYADATKLRFNGQLEQGFQTAYSRHFNRYIRWVMLASTTIFLLSGIYDFLLLAPHQGRIWEVRYLLGAPPLVLLSAYSFSHNFWRFQQLVLLIYILVITLSLALMAAISLPSQNTIYFTGALIAQMAGLNIMRLQFRYAVVGCITMVVFEVLVLAMFNYSLEKILTDVYFYGSVTLVSLMGNYFLERFARQDYLQKRLLDHEQERLKEMNQHLQHLVTSDALTGIANRRNFDETIQDEWRRAQRGHYPVSLLMIDIDFFKPYNDYYGHQKGDECLKQVGKILGTHGKRAGDLVARYGGEEFAIISAGTSYKDAIGFAQKICRSVANAKIPHAASPIANIVTASIGVATVIPLVDQQVKDLIADADKNLYQAKANGRNGVFGDQPTLSRLVDE